MNRGFWFAVTLMGSRAPSRVTCIQGRPPWGLLGGCWVGGGAGPATGPPDGHRVTAWVLLVSSHRSQREGAERPSR